MAGDARPLSPVRALVVDLPGGARMEVADGSQVALAAGRLEEGTFAWPKLEEIGAAKLVLRPEALAMPAGGRVRPVADSPAGSICGGAKLRPWYERP